jgi:serine/threonine protein kinase
MDKYKVLQKIGTGAYGSAYLVCSRAEPQRQFVLKKVQPHDATEREKQQAQNEVKLLARLHHPFVLRWAGGTHAGEAVLSAAYDRLERAH